MIKSAKCDQIYVAMPDREGQEPNLVVWISFETDAPKIYRNAVRLPVSIPFDPLMSHAEIVSQSVEELCKVLNDAANTPAERWIELLKQQPNPPRPV